MIEDKQPISDELRAAIDAKAARIEVDSYYTMAMNKGLKGHAMGFWSGTAMGIVFGAGSGAVVNLLAGSVLATFAGWPIIIGMATVGAGLGGTVGSRVGSAAGAVSGVMMEFERRQKARELEADVIASPEKQAQIISDYRTQPMPEKDDTVSEIFATSPTHMDGWSKIVAPLTMVLTTLLCAAAGALMGAGAFAISGGPGIGLGAVGVASSGAAAALGGALGAATGITFGINFPSMFAQGAQMTGTLLSGKTAEQLLGGKSVEPAVALSKTNAPSMAPLPANNPSPVAMQTTGPHLQIDATYAHREGTTIHRAAHLTLQ